MARVSEPSPSARPRQVTLAGWLSVVGSVVVVLLVFDRVSGLHTLETRESVERFLAEPPGRDLGVGTDGILALMRVAALVTGGCAAAAAILGWHVLRRSRSARLALTVVAVPLFLTGLVTGGFVSSLVAGSVVMLWMQPARDWFDGIVRPAPEPTRAAPAPAPPSAAPGTAGTPSTPGTPAVASYAATGTPAAVRAPVAVDDRPAAVTWAGILTWVGSGLTLAGTIASGIFLGLQPDVLLDEVRAQNPDLESQGVSDDLLIGVSFAMLVGFALWCAAACVIAYFVVRGHEWARITLIVSAATATAIFLLGTVAGAFLLAITLGTSIATIVLLVRPETRAWFAQRRRAAIAPGPPPPAGGLPPR